MGTLAQTVLPFKLEATEELLTANAGLALSGEFVRGLGLSRWLAQEMPKPGSGRGYAALATVLKQEALPSTDAVGDWLRRTGEEAGLAGLGRINQRIAATRIRQSGIRAHTLDGYQAGIFNYCEATGKTFAIGGRLDAPTQKTIADIPEAPRYHVIASNRIESTEATLLWYPPRGLPSGRRQRGEVSENGIKELKIGFGMERLPCGQFKANAAFFRIGVIAHNLFVLFKHSALDVDWQRHRGGTVRWHKRCLLSVKNQNQRSL